MSKNNIQYTFIPALILLLISPLIMFTPPANASEATWLNGYNNRMLFHYDNNQTIKNYQGKLTVINQTGINSDNTFYIFNQAQPDFEDLRITLPDGITILPIWNQTTVYGVSCTFWARFPTVAANYYLYWNCPDAEAAWDSDAVFNAVIDDVLLACPLDETNATDPAFDYSGQGNDGVATNTAIVEGKYSGTKARAFDDTSSKIDFPISASVEGKTEASIIVVYKPLEIAKENKAIYFESVGNSDTLARFGIFRDAGGILSVDFRDADDSVARSISAVSYLSSREYATVVATVNTTSEYLKLFVNGRLVGTNNESKNAFAYTAPQRVSVQSGTAYHNMELAGIYIVGKEVDGTKFTYNAYFDPRLEAGKLYFRNYAYPEPSITQYGKVEHNTELPMFPLIFFDSDEGGDPDGAVAGSILNTLMTAGECRIIGAVSAHSYLESAQALQTEFLYYNHPEVPIGINKHPTHNLDIYGTTVAKYYSSIFSLNDTFPDAVDVARQALTDSPDHSVTWLVTGQLDVLIQVYNSSEGKQLLTTKLNQLVIMGGDFPRSYNAEYNIKSTLTGMGVKGINALNEILTSGVKIVWSGLSNGAYALYDVADAPRGSYVQKVHELSSRVEYQDYVNHAYDPTAALYAVRGASHLGVQYFAISQAGTVTVTLDANTNFTEGEGNQYYVSMKANNVLTSIDDLATQNGNFDSQPQLNVQIFTAVIILAAAGSLLLTSHYRGTSKASKKLP